MFTKHLSTKSMHYAIISLLVIGALICIFPPAVLFFKWTANFAVHIMLFYFCLGLIFLIFRQARLTFVAFGACAILSLFLKNASSATFSLPTRTTAPTIKIAHFNLSNSDENTALTLEVIKNTQADLISVQEITPFWDSLLQQNLSLTYPYHYLVQDINLFGLGVYAQKQFLSIDTFCYQNIPNIIGSLPIANENKPFYFISTLTSPPASFKDYTHLTQHLQRVSQRCKQIASPLLAFGDYNMVPWSDEIQDFREKTQLLDSRRGFMPTYPHGTINIFWTPIDHIFFSPQFKCLNFETLSSATTTHLGIQGVFQLTDVPTTY